jgi:tripartite-type tricarboxylate transporter receptor subunit TctC
MSLSSRWRVLLSVVVAVSAATVAKADDYPSRPVRLIVGFTPGAAGDIAAREVGARMAQTLGQPVIIENKPGASSNIAADFVARAPKDGYTIFLGTVANALNAAITPNLSYDFSKDFAPIGLAAIVPVILVVHPATGVSTVAELIALAKSKPEQILYASTGAGTTPHLAGELLNAQAGIKMLHVPYPGSPQAVTDLLAGRTQVMFASASTVLPHVESGALRALASAARTRPSVAPNLPTMAELGMPDLDASIWFGIMAPAGTPAEVSEKLIRALDAAMKSEDLLSSLKRQGFEPLPGTPEEFASYIQHEMKKWSAAAQSAGLKK